MLTSLLIYITQLQLHSVIWTLSLQHMTSGKNLNGTINHVLHFLTITLNVK